MKKLLNDTITWNGESTRKEFWLTQLMFIGAFILAAGFAGFIAGMNNPNNAEEAGALAGQYVGSIMQFVLLYPAITIFKRRLNNAGWSGWWMLFPILNWIVAGLFPSKQN